MLIAQATPADPPINCYGFVQLCQASLSPTGAEAIESLAPKSIRLAVRCTAKPSVHVFIRNLWNSGVRDLSRF